MVYLSVVSLCAPFWVEDRYYFAPAIVARLRGKAIHGALEYRISPGCRSCALVDDTGRYVRMYHHSALSPCA